MWNDAESYLKKDKYIGPLIKKWGSCTIKKEIHKDYFESICANIIGQQLSGKAADTIFSRFKLVLGGNITTDAILAIEPQKLRDAGMSWGKVSFVKDLAEKTKSGQIQTKKLPDLPDEEVIKELVAVKGIGRWTAEMFLMFSLARPNVFPVDDLGIKKGFEKTTGLVWDKLDSPMIADKWWSPYKTVASWYLWRSLDNRD
jgi:DNA-3-methyladenine glycosylase II